MNFKSIVLLSASVISLTPAVSWAQDSVTVTGTRSERNATDVVGNQASVSGAEL